MPVIVFYDYIHTEQILNFIKPSQNICVYRAIKGSM